jgi:hypothetical protein
MKNRGVDDILIACVGRPQMISRGHQGDLPERQGAAVHHAPDPAHDKIRAGGRIRIGSAMNSKPYMARYQKTPGRRLLKK